MFKSSIWCEKTDLNPSFLANLKTVEIDTLIIQAGSARADNTIVPLISLAELTNFSNQVKTAVPGAQIYADILSATYKPDQSTPAARAKLHSSILNFYNAYPGLFQGIYDDTEAYTGTQANHLAYFNEGNTFFAAKSIPYYPWLDYTWFSLYSGPTASVGLYGANPYLEPKFKLALDKIADDSTNQNEYTLYLMIKHAAGYPDLAQQLEWMKQKLATNSYPKMSTIGFWRNRESLPEDWQAYKAFINPVAPPTYQEWIVTKTIPQPTQEWKITVQSQPGKISGWL